MDIRDGAGMGLLIFLLTGWEPINLPQHGFVVGIGNNCIIGCGNGMGMTRPKPAPLPFLAFTTCTILDILYVLDIPKIRV